MNSRSSLSYGLVGGFLNRFYIFKQVNRGRNVKLAELEITSPRHPLIKHYLRLAGSRRQRRLDGLLALEGPNLIREAIGAGIVPEAIFYTGRYLESSGFSDLVASLPAAVKRCLITPQLFKKIASTDTPQEVAALVPMVPDLPDKPGTGKVELALLLDRIRDPGNMGTIIRTAAAAGAEGIYYTAGTVDPYSPKALRSTAGAVFHRPPVLLEEPLSFLKRLKERGVQIITTGPAGGRPYWEVDLRLPTLFIIGNESRGVAPLLAERADHRVSIPQPGWGGSLNAAVSTAILLYETLGCRYRDRV